MLIIGLDDQAYKDLFEFGAKVSHFDENQREFCLSRLC